MKIISALLSTFLMSSLFASSSYYPTSYKELFKEGEVQDQELKDELFILLSSNHNYKRGQDDTISPYCIGEGKKCYRHKSLGYKGARKVLFGKIHLQEDSSGYFIKDVYCRKKITERSSRVGPNIIPNSRVLNCEHTWPQSKFSSSFEKGLQKSDLHHLYPTDSKANSIRGNNPFADVNGAEVKNCEGSYTSSKGRKSYGNKFEPPVEHKGNVARALFYFSVRYKVKISNEEERYLRKWHELDPVDAQEMERNNIIHKVQGDRNPFIDYPELVDQIANY